MKVFEVICPCCGKKIKIKGKTVVYDDELAFFDSKEAEQKAISEKLKRANIEFG